jgi:hypothetical protein
MSEEFSKAGTDLRAVRGNGKCMAAHCWIFKRFMVGSIRQPFAGPLRNATAVQSGLRKKPRSALRMAAGKTVPAIFAHALLSLSD